MKKHDFVKYFEKFTVPSSLITLSMQFYRPILNYLAKMSIILGNFGRQFTHNTRSNHHTNDPIWHPNNLSCKARASVKITHKVLHSKWIFGVKNKQIQGQRKAINQISRTKKFRACYAKNLGSSQDKNLFMSSQWKHYAFRSPLTYSIEKWSWAVTF